MCWEFYEVVNTKKKHIAYILMISHFWTDMKVSSLPNLRKKQWLIPLNSTLFCCDWICTGMAFWIHIVSINVVKKIKLFSHFDFVRHTSYEIVCVIILCFPPSVKIIPNCLMSNLLIGLFCRFGLIDYVLRILWSFQQ